MPVGGCRALRLTASRSHVGSMPLKVPRPRPERADTLTQLACPPGTGSVEVIDTLRARRPPQ